MVNEEGHLIKGMFWRNLSTNIYDREYIEAIQEENAAKAKRKETINKFAPQPGFQEEVLECEADILIIGGKRGGGKALCINELVCTPFGFRKIQDVHVGDIVIGQDGRFTKVIAETEIHKRECFRVSFSDGVHVDVSDEHLWKARRSCHQTKRRKLAKSDNGNIDLDSRIWTTRMMYDYLQKQKSGELKSNHNLLIPLCEPVRFTKSGNSMRRPNIDPYVIGVLLGDGCITGKRTSSFYTEDEEIAQEVAKSVSIKDDKLRGECRLSGVDNMLKELELYGHYSYNKFIPYCYKYAPVEERWSLIQGLMDTDGYIDADGGCYYTTTSSILAEDFKFVIETLGGTATITKGKAGYKKNGKYQQCKDVYDCYIRIPDTERLFRLTRKKERCRAFNGGLSPRSRRISEISPLGIKECKCIQVDNIDGLFLTNNCIVTHNSAIMTFLPLYEVWNPGFTGYGFRKEEDDIKRGLWTTSKIFYTGYANPTETNLTWTFPSGAKLKYEHLQNEKEVDRRYRGAELPLIFIDELPQLQEKTFFTLLGSNRNTIGACNKFVASCNPVSRQHWVHKLISWWINEDTREIIRERSGKIRYFFKYGNSVSEIIWGDSKAEVYEKAKGFIDFLIEDDEDPMMLISSLCFIEGDLKQNKIFSSLDSSYKGRLVQQGGTQAAKDIKGIWGDDDESETQISATEFENKFLDNPIIQKNGFRTCIIDVALTRDFMVLYAFDGNHIFDLEYFSGVFSDDAVIFIRRFLEKNDIREENMAYDENGIGIYLNGFFRKAKGFNNKAAASNPKLWNNQKSECCEKFVKDVKEGKYSINPILLSKKVPLKGKDAGYTTVRDRLIAERLALKRKTVDNGRYEVISKPEMKVIVGHSPDFIEGLIMHKTFEKRKGTFKNIGML